MRNIRKSSSIARTITIQFVIVLAALLFADVFLWMFFPFHLDNAPTNRTFEQILPGLKNRVFYESNRYGFRSLSMSQEKKPANTIRIFCIGASTTDQVTQNTEDTWCALLEKKLNKEFLQNGAHVETASFGRGGWKATDLYIWARRNMERFRPDIVITLMGINDLTWQGGPDYSYTRFKDSDTQFSWRIPEKVAIPGSRLSYPVKEVTLWALVPG